MNRPKLVNPKKWNPFQPISIIKPTALPATNSFDVPLIIPITRKDIIQKNSMFLNIFSIIFLIMMFYFLYGIYLERKVFTEYLGFLQSQQEPSSGLLASRKSIWDI